MNMMDWGDIGDFVSFGEVGRDQIDDSSYYILVAPQNVVGNTILTNLGDMVITPLQNSMSCIEKQQALTFRQSNCAGLLFA